MNSDPLEEEMRRFRPLPPSSALSQRLAESLELPDRVRSVGSPGRVWRMAIITGTLVAASVAAIALWLNRESLRQEPPAARVGGPGFEVALDRSLPTLWVYRSAMARSPAELEALLEKHATRSAAAASSDLLLVAKQFEFRPDTLQGEL
jgi:hypothetical protein